VHKRIAVVFFALAALLAVGFTAAHAQASDPWIGTWKVNLAKSTYSPGPKPTVAGTVKMEASGGGVKTTIDGANAQGQPTHTESVAMFDGKDNPVKGAPAPNSTTALKRIDARSFEATAKVDGKVTVVTRVAISADGKTLTATQAGKNAQGAAVKNVIVAERQ
jgi:hypothetical protein